MIDHEAMPFLADIPRHQSTVYGDKPAIWFEGAETSYNELNTRSSQVANGLIAAGVNPHDRVAYLGKNMDVFYEIMFGANKARAALAAMNNRLAAPELQFVLSDSQSVLLFVAQEFYDVTASILSECPTLKTVIAIDGGHDQWPSYAEWLDGQSQSDPNLSHDPHDDVLQLYTSGTTGLP